MRNLFRENSMGGFAKPGGCYVQYYPVGRICANFYIVQKLLT